LPAEVNKDDVAKKGEIVFVRWKDCLVIDNKINRKRKIEL
jgi:hypothetical protein